MKIAIVVWRLNISGGGQRQALEFANHLLQKGHKVDIFCCHLDKKNCYPELIRSLNVYSIDPSHANPPKPHSLKSLFDKHLKGLPVHNQSLLKLTDLLKEYDLKKHYDIVNYQDEIVYQIAPFFEKVRNVWMMNDLPGLLDVKQRLMAFQNISWGRKLRLYLYFVYTFYQHRFNLIKNIDKIVVLDYRNQKLVKKYFNRKAYVVRSGIDLAKFSFDRSFQIPKKTYNILVTNIFFPHRRYEDVIEALNILVNSWKIENVQVRIVGKKETDLNYYNRICSLIEKYKLSDRITILGAVSEKELVAEYQIADFFVFPNHNQTWGLSVFEAMLSGCVALVSRGAGAHEVLTDNQNALLFEPRSPLQIAEKIKELIQKPELIEKIARCGQRFVSENLSWEKYTAEMLEVFSA